MKKYMETMDGNTAASLASYYFTEVAAIYPITPSSPMAENVDQWSAAGKKNIFGSRVKLIEMQSEGGAAGTLHGSLQGGAMSTTYTSSQGLLLMIPNLYKVAGELLPGVLHVSARSLASNALSIFGDHQDVMSIRQTGMTLLASANVQECMDLGCIAHLAAVSSRVPVVHFFDGFRTSHEIQKIEVLDPEELKKIYDWKALDEFRARALNPDHPVLRGTTQNPDIFFQIREATNHYYDAVPQIVQGYMDQISEMTGRSYHLFDYYGDPQAELVLVAMGSSCEIIKETIDYLQGKGVKVGLLQVRLYRPFATEAFLAALPETVKKLVVLDRTKEPGANGEPLYQDICSAFYGKANAPEIICGRYGLASKEFAPKEVMAVIDNAMSAAPKNHFTVGIEDDMTFLSLPVNKEMEDIAPAGTVSCKFWGFGSDGTVGANKSAIKIIGNHTEQNVQAYFAYDSKKSGGLTVSHLRFGKEAIRSSYLVNHPDYVACHNQSYVGKYDLLEGIKPGAVFVLNAVWSLEELNKELPEEMKKAMLDKNLQVYLIDAEAVAQNAGLGRRINMVMQTVFFYLSEIIPFEDAAGYLKAEIQKNYGHQGTNVVEANCRAVDMTVAALKKVDLASLDLHTSKNISADYPDADAAELEYLQKIMIPVNTEKGNEIPVSAFKDIADGSFPTHTTRFEKRGVALQVPKWDAQKCIQCNRCALVCPHAVLRPKLFTQEELAAMPEMIRSNSAEAKGMSGKYFYMANSVLDCTGCGNCVDVCPAKEKALEMVPAETVREEEKHWELLKDQSNDLSGISNLYTVKNSQFMDTYFEFSGACAGCGETPYAKLITQLFGDRMMISASAGCTTVWSGSTPSVPYKKNKEGQGPAWGFSLFEDNAEYGLGMTLGYRAVREEIRASLQEIAAGEGAGEELKAAVGAWMEAYESGAETRAVSGKLQEALEAQADLPGVEEVLKRKDYFIKRSNWIFGGDGWAYDIGYGGLDHVLSTGNDINVMVFDTEVYSNTGGQSSKSTPLAAVAKFASAGKRMKKKELGMMAMQYGDVYVAQIALGADPAQALKAIQEAESYPGPSLIIGYAPCINHGIKVGMGKTQYQQKYAVEAGYWNLYRYDPRRKAEGLNPFQLDSRKPSADFETFLLSEVRFSALMKKDPELAKVLFAQAQEDAMERYSRYEKLSQ